MTLNNRILGIAALALALFLFVFGYGLQAPFAYEPVGPRAFPLMLSAIIGLCGLRLVFKGGGEVEPNQAGATPRIIAMIGLVFIYALSFQWLGFIIATTIIASLVGRLFGGTWLKVVGGSFGMSVMLFFLFDRGLDVVLPTGLLGGLL
ncbi:tripartite tricarboxylate transporter TctB family protein [Pigmentiphaga aceris]|uniref:Tripartite tricarboxylate transporter TctB family protein n=1 Tax=Pigmentiphaga aceris TaxID=1940612 RepID=A0A5C0B017_9BURK|nr:tripartite tricarboxylate transporter TctB family protein [Pigmentiphaga aceris]QEI07938.1 tripartite tricarboxylate transporter TctB family protein [Pigmentiphaga aceris]